MLYNLINSDSVNKMNIVHLYNLFFAISINFSKNFHQNIVIYFEAILDIIKHKILNYNTLDLKSNYSLIIDTLINKTFSVLSFKNKKTNSNQG